MNDLLEGKQKGRLQMAGLSVLVVLAVFLALLSVKELVGLRYVGTGIVPTNTITVNGTGKVSATPDIATFTYTVDEKKATVASAQESATAKTNAILAYLTASGVEEKDIQTSGYNVYPDYQYQTAVCTTYCPPARQILDGYHVSQSVTVKVRALEKAGELLAGVGEKGATNISGLTFTVDKEESLVADARDKAIQNAREKAEVLSKQLGVKLVRVVSFSESGNYPVPMYAYGMGGASDSSVKAVPQIPVGQNDISSNVSVTYEIR